VIYPRGIYIQLAPRTVGRTHLPCQKNLGLNLSHGHSEPQNHPIIVIIIYIINDINIIWEAVAIVRVSRRYIINNKYVTAIG